MSQKKEVDESDSYDIPTEWNKIETYDLLKLFKDIVECIEDQNGKTPYITMYDDSICTFELDDKRFRLEIKNMSRFN